MRVKMEMRLHVKSTLRYVFAVGYLLTHPLVWLEVVTMLTQNSRCSYEDGVLSFLFSFFWLIIKNSVLAWDRIQGRNIGWLGFCCLCYVKPSPAPICFWACPFSRQVWKHLEEQLNLMHLWDKTLLKNVAGFTSPWATSRNSDHFPFWLNRASS